MPRNPVITVTGAYVAYFVGCTQTGAVDALRDLPHVATDDQRVRGGGGPPKKNGKDGTWDDVRSKRCAGMCKSRRLKVLVPGALLDARQYLHDGTGVYVVAVNLAKVNATRRETSQRTPSAREWTPWPSRTQSCPLFGRLVMTTCRCRISRLMSSFKTEQCQPPMSTARACRLARVQSSSST